MSLRISFEMPTLPDVTSKMQDIDNNLQNSISDGLAYAVDTQLLPVISEYSTVVWNVRTGNYYTNWYRQVIDGRTVMVDNEMPYSRPLETGWTLRDGSFRESPGVATPIAFNRLGAMAEALQTWIKQTLIR